jgi:hypothetical protein
MSNIDLEKRKIPDLGEKISHLEGVMGAYLPNSSFDGKIQQKLLGCDKTVFSRMKSGQRHVANWELGRLTDHFRLSTYKLDYRVFLNDFDGFDSALREKGVGTYGDTASGQLRKALRQRIDMDHPVEIRRVRDLNVGGIGMEHEDDSLLRLRPSSQVTVSIRLTINIAVAPFLFILHDYPEGHAMSCLMPSKYAPASRVSGDILHLPLPASGLVAFPVGGRPGYRCLYAIQSSKNFPRIIGLEGPESGVVDITHDQLAQMLIILENTRNGAQGVSAVTFAEYTLVSR